MQEIFGKSKQESLPSEQQIKVVPLVTAIEQKKSQEVRRLIREGVSVNVHALGGRKTPLHLAVDMQDEEIVGILIEAKAEVNAVTKSKTTPLHVASQRGHSRLIEKLINASAMPNCVSEVGCTPLHEAAVKGHLAAVKKLLELKADPTIRDSRFKLTAANIAHEKGHARVRETLVEAMTYQQQFIQNIHYILFNWKRGFLQGSRCYQFLEDLGKQLGDTEDADAVFLSIRTALRSPSYEPLKEELAPVRTLFVVNMQKYNLDKKEALSRRTDSISLKSSQNPKSSSSTSFESEAESFTEGLTSLSLDPKPRPQVAGGQAAGQPSEKKELAAGVEAFRLGLQLYNFGQYREALPYFTQAGEDQYPPAYLWLGLMHYEEEGGIPKNVQKAAVYFVKAQQKEAWFKEQVLRREAEGQCLLGHYFSVGAKRDFKQAAQWYRRAAEQKDSQAQYQLGLCYMRGQGVEKDVAQAVNWFLRAATQGLAEAQFSLSLYYLQSSGVKEDAKEAVSWLHRAAEQGPAEAQFTLGQCYDQGCGITKDAAKAVEWYRRAAEQNHPEAQHSLGCCYREGKGVTQDDTQAAHWFRRAAEQGCAEAQGNLGWCYAKGRGVEENTEQAVHWYRRAAEQGNATAQYTLGLCYENGTSVSKDLQQAKQWYEKAAAQGYKDAKSALRLLQLLTSSANNSRSFFALSNTTKADRKPDTKQAAGKRTRGAPKPPPKSSGK